jgi:cardiolipin synthase
VRPLRTRPLSTRPLIYGGNRIRLLRSGAEYFPALLEAIEGARSSVHLETYIFEVDAIGLRVAEALAAAARRGVGVHVLVDGYGSVDTAVQLATLMEPAGVRFAVYRPARWWQLRRSLLRRLHRKIAVIDQRLAFVGGINIIDDRHHPDPDPASIGPRYDFAVSCEGPIVAPILLIVTRLWRTVARLWRLRAEPLPDVRQSAPLPENMRASLLLRDNLRFRRTIGRAYLDAIDGAQREVVIANAYFLPGRRFREALCTAARRGVRVRLLLQGRVEYRLQHYAQQSLYDELLKAGVEIHEYAASYLHAKVAVVDAAWATVGSSNIDPYSLLLAREANIAVYERGFAAELRTELGRALQHDAVILDPAAAMRRTWWHRCVNRIAYWVVRMLTLIATRRLED